MVSDLNSLNHGIMIYASGKIVSVTKDSIRSTILELEQLFDLPEKDYDFNLIYSTEQGRASASFIEDSIKLCEKEHEAVKYHECVHFLMKKQGIIFRSSETYLKFYDQLLNETIAELATYQKYGYKDETIKKIKLKYERERNYNESLNATIANLKIAGLVPNILHNAFTAINIADMHQQIEERYVHTKSFDEIDNDMIDFFKDLAKQKNITPQMIAETAALLSIDNVKRLTNGRVCAKDLFYSLKDGLDNNWSSYELYFYDVIAPST